MRTWLFTWNVDRWAWNDSINGYKELKSDIEQVGHAYSKWTCGVNKSIQKGDRIFLIKLGSDALYDPQETAAILKGFNDAIRGLYSIGGEEQYIFNVLNTTTPVIKEYERLTKDMGIDLIDVANFDRIYSI